MTTVPDAFESMEWGTAPESRAEAMRWLDRHERRLGHFIDGQFVAPAEPGWLESMNPANAERLARVAKGSRADVDRAVAAARAAQPGWWAAGPRARAQFLYAMSRAVQRHSRLLAVLESLDNGKPIRESRDIDVPLVARHFFHHAGWAALMAEELPGYRPVGVVGQIIPWNFPLLMLAWKVAPALALGNTVVLKPAEYTPLTALCFAELCGELGLPPGVLNIVTGDGATGEALVAAAVDKIAFTGSTEVGRAIRVATAGTGKKLSLELGGKSPFVVFDDADLDAVVEGVVDAIWFNQGQVCCAGSRILAQEPIADALTHKLRARMETLRIGDPLDKSIDIGAIIAPVQLERITRLVQRGVEEGATLWQPSWRCPAGGLFYPPTLFTEVAPSSTIAQVEIFGPVVVAMTFRTPAEAVELANNTRYGLAASVWTENVNVALDIAPALQAGTVWINCTNRFDAAAGFGGYRESGFGREGGREGLFEYVVRDASGTNGASGRSVARRRPRSGAGLEADSGRTDGGAPAARGGPAARLEPLDRTYKLFIAGKQVRPDGGGSMPAHDAAGRPVFEVATANRKDVRQAVEAARRAQPGWAAATAHARGQIVAFFAENLAARRGDIGRRIARMTGVSTRQAVREVDESIGLAFRWAAWADKHDGRVHATPFRNVVIAMHEPIGVLGIIPPPSSSLLGFVSSFIPPVALGNAVVALAPERWPVAAADCSTVLESSDVPAGIVNILTGPTDALAAVLSDHDAVDAVWYFGPEAGRADVERRSAGNLKRTWVSAWPGDADECLREATHVKNIWIPYGA